MKKTLTEKVIKALYKSNCALNTAELAKLAGIKKTAELKPVLADLSKKGMVTQGKSGWKPSGEGFFKAEVTRVFRAHGFIRDVKTGEEFFVPGRKLLGGVPGDYVLARVTSRERAAETSAPNGAPRSAAAEAVLIDEAGKNVLIGTVVREKGEFFIVPDSFVCDPLAIFSYGGFKPREGDKVSFAIHERGDRHCEHTTDITAVYGSGMSARVCVNAYLDEKNIPYEFSKEAKEEARFVSEKGIKSLDFEKRLDLRDEIIFTIDGADTKDIDDAISVERTAGGYKLGVHIADVSHYVKKGRALDADAFQRGTSVYIADMVIPMLPKELSNGICSLNPKEERLAFSCLMDISKNGETTGFRFVKTVIKSRVQGVYSEINKLLSGSGGDFEKGKYGEVSDALPVMAELAAKLQQNRKDRGAPFIETSESKIICDENGVCADVKKREAGASENIIEEFMLAANNSAAKLAMEAGIPFVYRVHEEPALEKIEALKETLSLVGFGYNIGGRGASDLAGIIEKARGTDKAGIINMLVLRAMMKAKYSDEPLGHYGLVMKEYAHFTSPIRRYPDLSIHRILSDFIEKKNITGVRKKYGKFAHESGTRSSFTELRAVNAERDCEKFFMAEYMQNHVGEEYDGIISGVGQNGFFVTLENTVEGRVGGESLGVCSASGNVSLTEQISGKIFSLGDKVRVKCVSANVAFGMIDFIVV